VTDERPTVRGLIKAIQLEIRDTDDLLPDRASVLLNHLTAMIGNCNDELRAADLDYKRILLACLRENTAANRAKIEAEISPEYVRRQEAQHTKDLAVEMIRSLRAFLRAKAEEMRLCS
jgi:NurA-like 5'-3' nuclease